MSTIIAKATEVYNAIMASEEGTNEYKALVALFNDIENSTLARYEGGEFTYDEMLQFFGIEG